MCIWGQTLFMHYIDLFLKSFCLYVVHLVVIIHDLVTLAYIYWCCSSKGFTCFKNTVVPCTVLDFTCCVTFFFLLCCSKMASIKGLSGLLFGYKSTKQQQKSKEYWPLVKSIMKEIKPREESGRIPSGHSLIDCGNTKYIKKYLWKLLLQ